MVKIKRISASRAKGWREFRSETEAYDWQHGNGGYLLRQAFLFAWTDSRSVRDYLIRAGWDYVAA